MHITVRSYFAHQYITFVPNPNACRIWLSRNFLNNFLQKQRAEGEDVGKGFGKGKPKKRGSPSAFGGFYYPSPLLRFALCEKLD